MDLFFVVSFLNMEQKKTVVDIINEKLLISNEESDEDKMTEKDELEEETPIMNEELTSETICEKTVQNESESSSHEGSKSNTSSYLQIIQKFYENSKMTKGQSAQDSPCAEDNSKHADTVDETEKDNVNQATKTNPNDVYSPSKKKEKCSVCDILVSRKNMRIHMRIRHKAASSTDNNAGQIVDCSFCSKKLRKDSLRRHMKMVHKLNKEDQEKVIYDEVTDTVDEIQNSNNEKQTEQNLQSIKREKVESQEQVRVMKKSKGSGKSKISKNNSKENPKETESGYRKCKLCFKNLKNNYYRRHLKEAHSGKQNKCELCYAVFTRKETIKDHIDRVHKLEVELLDEDLNPKFTKEDCTFQCRACSKKFISEAVMKYHDTRKHGSGNIECETCHKRFKDKTAINKHKSVCIVIDTLMP